MTYLAQLALTFNDIKVQPYSISALCILTGIFAKRFYNWAEQQFKGIKITASAAIYYFVPPSKPLSLAQTLCAGFAASIWFMLSKTPSLFAGSNTSVV
jgi:hypothetical protein